MNVRSAEGKAFPFPKICLPKLLKKSAIIYITSKPNMNNSKRYETALIAAALLVFAVLIFSEVLAKPKITPDLMDGSVKSQPYDNVSVPRDKTDKRININTADLNELQALPGIGPLTAEKIIEYRTLYGDFLNTDELLNVYGIGEIKLSKFISFIKTED